MAFRHYGTVHTVPLRLEEEILNCTEDRGGIEEEEDVQLDFLQPPTSLGGRLPALSCLGSSALHGTLKAQDPMAPSPSSSFIAIAIAIQSRVLDLGPAGHGRKNCLVLAQNPSPSICPVAQYSMVHYLPSLAPTGPISFLERLLHPKPGHPGECQGARDLPLPHVGLANLLH